MLTMLRPIVYMLGETNYLGLLVYCRINLMRKVTDVLSCINLKDDTIINEVLGLRHRHLDFFGYFFFTFIFVFIYACMYLFIY